MRNDLDSARGLVNGLILGAILWVPILWWLL